MNRAPSKSRVAVRRSDLFRAPAGSPHFPKNMSKVAKRDLGFWLYHFRNILIGVSIIVEAYLSAAKQHSRCFDYTLLLYNSVRYWYSFGWFCCHSSEIMWKMSDSIKSVHREMDHRQMSQAGQPISMFTNGAIAHYNKPRLLFILTGFHCSGSHWILSRVYPLISFNHSNFLLRLSDNWYTYRDPRRLVEPPVVVSFNQKQLTTGYVDCSLSSHTIWCDGKKSRHVR